MGNLKNVSYSLLNVLGQRKFVKECYEGIIEAKDYSSRVNYLVRTYRLARDVAENYMFNGKVMSLYYRVLHPIIDCEDAMRGMYICNPEPKYVYNPYFRENYRGYFNSEEALINYLIYYERTRMHKALTKGNMNLPFNTIDLTNECMSAAVDFHNLCRSYGLKSYYFRIAPGYSDDIKLYGGNGYHYFNIVIINGHRYLVDLTYRQFFKTENNLRDRLGVMGLNGCHPGFYMMMNQSRQNTARGILRDGWVPGTAENLKNYLDGFTLSFRNGLYYEGKDPRYRYLVSYSLDDYARFLLFQDSMFRHEDIRMLGEQQEPLLNKKINF